MRQFSKEHIADNVKIGGIVITSVLIVDDSAIARRIAKRSMQLIFAKDELDIFEAADGERAIELCKNERYSLVLLDLTMPDISGYDVLRRLREDGIDQTVVVLSADIQPGARKAVLDLGAAAFLKKPFELEEAKKILKGLGVT
jgi:two-component system, chemotaxis family, chemotaxis protein CheY